MTPSGTPGYSAAYCYLAALYAREQQRTAKDILEKPLGLNYLHDTVESIVKNGLRKDVTEKHQQLVDSYRSLVAGRKAEADQGYERAVAALREAMNIGPGCRIELADTQLPPSDAVPDKDQIVQLAVARRGEVVMATTAEQVLGLEVDAQGRLLLPSARTFASGADIHAHVLPAAQYDPEYRPGPVGPEMPANLVGSRRAQGPGRGLPRPRRRRRREDAEPDRPGSRRRLPAPGAIRHRGEEARRGRQGLRRLRRRPVPASSTRKKPAIPPWTTSSTPSKRRRRFASRPSRRASAAWPSSPTWIA